MQSPMKPALSRTNTKILNDDSPHSKMQRRTSSILREYPSHLAKSSDILQEQEPAPEDLNSWMYDYLPKDILFFVFKMLGRNDLGTASIVCKYWRKIAKDPYFGWTTLHSFDMRVNTRLYQGEGDGGDPVDMIVVEKNPDPSKGWWNIRRDIVFLNEKKEHLFSVEERYLSDIDKHKNLCASDPSMYRWFLQKKDDKNWTFVTEINVLKYEEHVVAKTKLNPPWIESQVWKAIKDENLRVSAARINSECIGSKVERRPKKTTIPQKQPPGFKEEINMYKYQLDALSWLKSVEDDIAAGITYKYTTVVPWRSARTRFLYDIDKHKIVTADQLKPYTFSFKPRGAVLADEMGLGKTIEMLGLILANPASDEEVEAYKTWNNRIPKDEELIIGKSKENHLDKLRYKTRATLIACPNHLAQQWQDELTRHTDPPLRVLRFTTMNELKASTYQEVMDADAVVFSYQLLKNGNYSKIGTSRSSLSRFERPYWVSNQLKRVMRSIKDGERVKDPPLLEHFEWRRMILDEAHEVINDEAAKDTFAMYPAKHYWYVSGTPFPNRECLDSMMKFFNYPQINRHHDWTLTDIMLNNLYWRSTKESVKDEFTVPPVVEDIVMLDFSDTERALYQDNAGKEEIQRKLCSQLLDIDQSQNLTDLNRAAINMKINDIKDAEAKIEDQQKEIAHLKTLTFAYVPTAIAKCKAEKQKLKKKIEHHKHIISLLEAAASFKDRLQHLESVFHRTGAQTSSNNNNTNEFTREQTSDQMEEDTSKEEPKISKQDAKPEQKESDTVMEAEKEAEKKKPTFISADKIKKMTVPQLKKELGKYGLEPKKLKADLVAQLQEYISQHAEEPKEQEDSDDNSSNNNSTKKRKETESEEQRPAKKPKGKQQLESPPASSQEMTKYELAKELLYLVENFGTKMANIMFYLKRLWDKKPEARVIIFSQYNSVLDQVSDILDKGGIPSVFVTGTVISKTKALNAFKAKDSPVRVIMLSLEKAASGTNLMEASHVILVDPVVGTRKEAQAVEAQAVGRAYRQGQSGQVTMVRFLIKDTIEHRMYIKNYLEEEQQHLPHEPSAIQQVLDEANALKLTRTMSSRPNMFRSSSITTLLVNSPVKSSASVVALIENVNDQLPPATEADATEAQDAAGESSNNNNNNNKSTLEGQSDNNQQAQDQPATDMTVDQ